MIRRLKATQRESGQGLAEYSLILTFVAIAAVTAYSAFGLALTQLLDGIAGAF